ncbi:hypothetical protein Tfer_1042 [Thermincola ferriacetica]|uniref:Small acid-soluble spore protein alpha/beta type n=1 Tax=Thermincola ferriacetica TaxID=281456 RepID=A0A0L6W3L0_9FIRM|nr:small, acid-soluble spore protein, alpha/beta type [Thermincola ferriacetica]KNZ70172.1 hypothetical protein Tfer_1042 [Thermincola ferriacetica]
MKKKQSKSRVRVLKKKSPLTPQEKLKYEVAKELGLWDRIKEVGWAGLTAAETGKIGGYMTKISLTGKKEVSHK